MWDIEAQHLFKILLSLALGGLIGIEREFYRKPAGIRTNCLICLGATLFTILSLNVPGRPSDPARIAAQIIPGVGFLGAGAILRDQGRVLGLTTAAGIWMVAALGMAVGMGEYVTAVLTTLVGLGVLRILDFVEGWMDRLTEARSYHARVADAAAFAQVEAVMAASEVRCTRRKQMRVHGGLAGSWDTSGRKQAQETLVEKLLAEPTVLELTW